MDPIFRPQMIRKQPMRCRIVTEQSQATLIANRDRQSSLYEALPKVAVKDHMPHWSVVRRDWNAPVPSDAVAALPVTVIEWFAACTNESSMAGCHHGRMRTLPAEAIHDFGGMSPVGIDQTSFDKERRAILLRPGFPEQRAIRLGQSRLNSLAMTAMVWLIDVASKTRMINRSCSSRMLSRGRLRNSDVSLRSTSMNTIGVSSRSR